VYVYVYKYIIHACICAYAREGRVRERAPPEDRRPADEREVDGVARSVRGAQHRRDLYGNIGGMGGYMGTQGVLEG
jgi:hypothetical protein